jgi:hypothetical protein
MLPVGGLLGSYVPDRREARNRLVGSGAMMAEKV